MKLETEKIQYWRSMKRIRLVEEAIAEAYPEGKMRCPTHLSIGQEAGGAAVGLICRKNDLVVSTHRAHAHYLGKGGDLFQMIAEIHGKSSGCSRGMGGSMHLVDKKVGFVGSTAIVANTIPVGVGLALSIKIKRSEQVSVVFLGDGAVEEGVFYESVNFAAVKELPVLFLCENNLYSVYSPLSVRQPKGRSIRFMVEAMGVNSMDLNPGNTDGFLKGLKKAIEYVRLEKKPLFLEIPTYRWREHCGPHYDNDLGYRSEAEFEDWKKCDPLNLLESELLESDGLTHRDIEQTVAQLTQEIQRAFQFADNEPYPKADSISEYTMASNPDLK